MIEKKVIFQAALVALAVHFIEPIFSEPPPETPVQAREDTVRSYPPQIESAELPLWISYKTPPEWKLDVTEPSKGSRKFYHIVYLPNPYGGTTQRQEFMDLKRIVLIPGK